MTVGLFRFPSLPPTPFEVRAGSANPWYGLWQLAHESVWSLALRGSK